MALPHLPTTYTTSKNIYERSIVDKRNRENEFRQTWLQNATFFQQADLTAAKKRTWESDISFNDSMNAWKTSHTTETKTLNLQRRKVKLREMLRQEQAQLEAELRELNADLSSARLGDMKDRAGSLKSAREEKRKQMAQELLYEHWKVNNPKLKQLESELHKKHVVGEWGKQMDLHQQRMAEERRLKEVIERRMEEERLDGLDREAEKERERLDEERRLKQMQKDQIRELKEKELEAQRLKDDEEMLMHNQWQLEELENHRREVEKQRRKVEFGRVLLRQHAAALRRRSCVIQQELIEDRKFLERLMAQEEEDRAIQTARREKTKADAAWMKQVGGAWSVV
ncbi:Trichoplein keratin filament-binding protein [Lamellibrachia satsuma]|nr:Trichoplein keratin filament-binding protein [Lamellibrachia satsuma]